jgi:autotransporter-associated beta strand protein
VENNDAEASLINAGPSTLTLNVAAGSNLVFSGYLRNYRSEGAGASNILIVVKAGAGTQILSGQNIGNGGIGGFVVQAGDLVLTNTIGLTTGVRVEGGRLVLASQTAMNNRSITNGVAGGVAFRTATAFTIGGLSGTGSIGLTNETGAEVALTVGGSNQSGTYDGTLDGPGSLVKTGTGVLTLTGANTYTGLTTVGVNAGHLVVGHNSALGTTDGGTVVAEGGNLVLADGVTVTGEALSLAGGGDNHGALKAGTAATGTWAGVVVLDDPNTGAWRPRLGARPDGVLNVSGDIVDGAGSSLYISGESGTGRVIVSGTNNTYSGVTAIVRGVLELGRDHTLPAGTRLDLNAAGIFGDASVLDMAGYSQSVAGLRTASMSAPSLVTNSAAGLSVLTVDQATNLTFGGAIGGNLELVKTGAGTLTLQGDSTYGGATSVSGGVLRVNGTHTGGGLITVFNGGTLGGTGTVGAVSVQGGGVLGAGNSVGTMSFVGDVEILGSLAVENAGAAADLLAVTGHLTLGAGSVLDLLGTLDGLSSYTILTFTGTRTGTFGDVSDVTAQGYQVDYNANDVTLTVIPEPATLGLLGLCAAAVLLRRRLRA